jgi:tyrosinase
VFIGGLVGDINRSPADPLFFLLHANVDRAWAAWQRFYGRFDRAQASHYAPQGSHSSQSSLPMGNFVDDTMWPWDGVARPAPDAPVLTTSTVVLPPNPGPGSGVAGHPQVGDTLDYLDMLNLGKTQGFCYDSIPRGVGSVAPFWP